MEVHNIEPVYDENSRVLILGSFPSVKSREQVFFYAHPQNRFWKVMSCLLNETLPLTIAEKKEMLIKHNIAVWDVIKECSIQGSSDSSIENVVPNDLERILNSEDIKKIFINGEKAFKLYKKYCGNISINAIKLPSTSPANARYSLERLCNEWKIILEP